MVIVRAFAISTSVAVRATVTTRIAVAEVAISKVPFAIRPRWPGLELLVLLLHVRKEILAELFRFLDHLGVGAARKFVSYWRGVPQGSTYHLRNVEKHILIALASCG
jgi:hypothetical protein